MPEPIGEVQGDVKINEPVKPQKQAEENTGPSEQPVQPTESQQQRMERRRDETKKAISIIAANMIDLDEQKVEPKRSSIDILRDMKKQIGELPEHPEIYHGLVIANARDLSVQLLAEIDRRRKDRGEPPAEEIFDPNQASEVTPITSIADSVDMAQLSTALRESIADLPHEVTKEFDKSDNMWGRVNVLKHEDVVFGVAHTGFVFDQRRERLHGTRYLYRDGRYAGRWEEEINYYKDDDSPSKKLKSYQEIVLGNDDKPVEEIEAKFYGNGQVYKVNNIHYANGEKTGTTKLAFTYDKDGNITDEIQTELDQSGNQLSETKKTFKKDLPLPANEELSTPSSDLFNTTPIVEASSPKPVSEKPNVLRKIGGFFGRR